MEYKGLNSSRNHYSDLAVTLGVLFVCTVILLPLPKFILDILLSFSITLSLVLLLMAVYSKHSLEFKTFPSILLAAILFRLGLNIATTRLILLNGADEGFSSVGQVIEGFGKYMLGGNHWLGIFVFIILFAINFIIITKSLRRILEVASLQLNRNLPDQLKSIEKEVTLGSLTKQQVRSQQIAVFDEIHFYETFDRAAKLIRWDALASTIMVFINTAAGLILGTIQKGKSLSEAFNLYLFLAISSALVVQIPALFASTASYILVTRTHDFKDLMKQMTAQLKMHPRIIGATALMMFILSMVPGWPHVLFLILSVVFGATAYRMIQKQKDKTERFEHAS